jgi:hypothetical protein
MDLAISVSAMATAAASSGLLAFIQEHKQTFSLEKMKEKQKLT